MKRIQMIFMILSIVVISVGTFSCAGPQKVVGPPGPAGQNYLDVLGEKFRVFYGIPPEETLVEKAKKIRPTLKSEVVVGFYEKTKYPWWVLVDAGHPMTADLDPEFINASIGAVLKGFDSPILPYTTKELILHACCMTAHFAVGAHLYPVILAGFTLDQTLEAVYVIHWAAGMMTMADNNRVNYLFMKDLVPANFTLEDTYTYKLKKSIPDKTTAELLTYFNGIYGSDSVDKMGWSKLAEIDPRLAKSVMFRWYALRESSHLDKMAKELMGFAVGMQQHNAMAMQFHLKGAINAGATKAQLVEAIAFAKAAAGDHSVASLIEAGYPLLKDLK